MNASILSKNPVDGLASKVPGMVASRLGDGGPPPTSYDDIDRNGFPDGIDLAIVILAAEVERGLNLVRQARQNLSVPVMAVGHISDSKLILRALQNGAEHYLNQEEI